MMARATKAKHIKVTLIHGLVTETARQKANVHGLGLHRIGQSVVVPDTPSFRGQARAVRHLVTVEEVD
jgi:large subunit ribosomal protein L30